MEEKSAEKTQETCLERQEEKQCSGTMETGKGLFQERGSDHLKPVLQRSKGKFRIPSDGSSCSIQVVVGSGWWRQCWSAVSSLFLGVSLAGMLTPELPSVSDCFQAWLISLPVNSVCYLISCQWIPFLLRLTRVGSCWLQLRTLLAQCLELGRHPANMCWTNVWIIFLLTWNQKGVSSFSTIAAMI